MNIRPGMSWLELVAAFTEIGRVGAEPSLEKCGDARRVSQAILCGNGPWETLASGLSPEEIRDLIRGLVLYSRAVDEPIGGSVSPVIVLYRALTARHPTWEPEFTAWIVSYRRNQWEPFGTLNDGGVTTLQAFRSRGISLSREQAERYEAGVLRQTADQYAKLQRDRLESTQRIAAAVRRGDRSAVEALLKKGPELSKALPQGQSLVDMASAQGYFDIAALLRAYETS